MQYDQKKTTTIPCSTERSQKKCHAVRYFCFLLSAFPLLFWFASSLAYMDGTKGVEHHTSK